MTKRGRSSSCQLDVIYRWPDPDDIQLSTVSLLMIKYTFIPNHWAYILIFYCVNHHACFCLSHISARLFILLRRLSSRKLYDFICELWFTFTLSNWMYSTVGCRYNPVTAFSSLLFLPLEVTTSELRQLPTRRNSKLWQGVFFACNWPI